MKLKLGFRGSKIATLQVPRQSLKFLDLMTMAPPGFSLAQLVKTVGVSHEDGGKFAFPFELLQPDADGNVPFLEKPLPSDPNLWYNRLKGAPIPAETVREALKLYNSGKFSNAGEFLRRYLIQDIAITIKTCNTFLSGFEKEFGVHPLSLPATTISSYSFNVLMNDVSRNNEWAGYTAGGSLLYPLLKESCRGGINFTGISQGGGAFSNPIRGLPDYETESYMSYFDINAQYALSVSYIIIFLFIILISLLSSSSSSSSFSSRPSSLFKRDPTHKPEKKTKKISPTPLQCHSSPTYEQ